MGYKSLRASKELDHKVYRHKM